MSNQALLGVLRVQIVGGGQDELPIYQSVVKLGRGKDNDCLLYTSDAADEMSEV